LLPEIRAMGVPVVVVTAHEKFAVDAFDGDAADYLLKPVELSRLARALTRIRKLDRRDPADPLIMLGDQSSCWPLRQDEIVMVESEGKNVVLHLKDRGPIPIPRSLKEIEDLLNESQFVRVNRYRIVQLLCLKEIRRRAGAGNFVAELDGHGTIEFSRRQSIAFRQRFGF
jgi:two-component system LytT family response regulator